MIRRLHSLVAGLGLVAVANASLAQSSTGDTVYRCGPDGRSYSTTPCASGKPVDAADTRSEEQQRQARDTAQRERQLADKLTAERLQREQSIKPAAAGHIGVSAKAAVPASKPVKPHKPKRKKKGQAVDPTLSEPVRTVTPKS